MGSFRSSKYPDTARTVHTLYLDAGGGEGIGDKISRVTALASAGNRGVDDANVYAAYAYNGAGRIVLETQKNAGATVAELDYYQGEAGTYAGFDRFGRIVDQKWHQGDTVKDRYGYGYDRNSNRTRRENVLAADRSEVYAYDMLDRLAGMDRGTLNEGKSAIFGTPARQEDWTLSQAGNWAGFDVTENGQAVLNQTRTNNKANEITGLSEPESQTQWVTPEYDARGNMITVPKPNSPANAFTCTWDAWDRLVEVKDGEATVARYAYDGLNHRITKTVGATIRHAYYNADWQLLETRKTTDPEAAPEDLNPEFQFVWSQRYIDAPVLRDENKNADNDCTDPEDQRLFYLNDANMNVTALVNTSGTVLERYAYTPYGKPSFFDANWQPRSASAYDNSILYCGYFYDSETGLYHVRYRYLHPMLSWVSRDRDYYDGMSLYEYVSGRAPRSYDPLGLAARGPRNMKVTTVSLSITESLFEGSLEGTLWSSEWCCPQDCAIAEYRGKWVPHYTIKIKGSVTGRKTYGLSDLPGKAGIVGAMLELAGEHADLFFEARLGVDATAHWDGCNRRIRPGPISFVAEIEGGGKVDLYAEIPEIPSSGVIQIDGHPIIGWEGPGTHPASPARVYALQAVASITGSVTGKFSFPGGRTVVLLADISAKAGAQYKYTAGLKSAPERGQGAAEKVLGDLANIEVLRYTFPEK